MPKQRLVRLYARQRGLCWVCGLAMLPPSEETTGSRPPHAFEATLDYLLPRNSRRRNKQRPARAAHAECNRARHHYPLDHPKVLAQIRRMQLKFER